MRAGPMQRVMLDSRARRGFTLVELMVAMVAGLFVSIAVFTLAKHASAFAMYDEPLDSSPTTACTPRCAMRSPRSGSRTRAVTSWPARSSASRTAAPT